MRSTCLVPVLLLAACSSAARSHWGSFRGPGGAGVREGALIPALDAQTEPAWRVEIPAGYSSPVLSDDALLLTGWEDERALLLCYDQVTGAERWRREAPSPAGHYGGPNSPVSPSPVTNGEVVVVLFPSFGMLAYDLAGDELWRRQLGPFNVPHMMSSSPVLAGDRILVQADQDTDGFLAAFDLGSGDQLWSTPREGILHGYATPIVNGREVIVSGAYQLAAYDLDSGERRWWVDGMGWMTKSIPVVEDGHVYVSNYMGAMSEFGAPQMVGSFEDLLAERDADGDSVISKDEWDDPMLKQLWFLLDLNEDDVLGPNDWDHATKRGQARGGVFAIALGGSGDVTDSHVAWVFDDRRCLPDIPSPIVAGEHLYLLKDGGILTVLDRATGAVVRKDRVGEPDGYSASPVLAGGRLLLTGKSGRLTVLTADPEWVIEGVVEIDETTWATPALGEDTIFVRTDEALYAFDGAR